MILKLSNLLCAALDGGTYDLIPLESELKFIREYLDIEKLRLGDRLEIYWLVSPEASRFLVPQMILQPLVENAIRHGIAPAHAGGWIEVKATAENGMLNIYVRNTTEGNGGVRTADKGRESIYRHPYLESF